MKVLCMAYKLKDDEKDFNFSSYHFDNPNSK